MLSMSWSWYLISGAVGFGWTEALLNIQNKSTNMEDYQIYEKNILRGKIQKSEGNSSSET